MGISGMAASCSQAHNGLSFVFNLLEDVDNQRFRKLRVRVLLV